MMRSFLAALAACLLVAGAAGAGEIRSSVDPATLPKGKLTPLGLYLSPRDAFEAVSAEPSILFVDVRDPIEIMFVGLPVPVDAIVPLAFATLDYDPKAQAYRMRANPGFLADFERIARREGIGRDHPIIVMCRSGHRSARAAAMLAGAGYTNVWSLVEGFEGDREPGGEARTVNGWKNAGLPWTYRIAPGVAYVPAASN